MSELSEPTDAVYGKITDEAVAQVRARLHRVHPIEQPFIRYVNGDSIAHVARAIGDGPGAVTTDVIKGVNFAVAIASDDQRFINNTTGTVITGQFELFKPADQLPCFGKN